MSVQQAAGRYIAYTVLFSGDYPERPEMTMLAIPSITLDSDQSFTAALQHPLGGGWVSLRAKHTDSSGNIVEQTIIHAYRITSGAAHQSTP